MQIIEGHTQLAAGDAIMYASYGRMMTAVVTKVCPGSVKVKVLGHGWHSRLNNMRSYCNWARGDYDRVVKVDPDQLPGDYRHLYKQFVKDYFGV